MNSISTTTRDIIGRQFSTECPVCGMPSDDIDRHFRSCHERRYLSKKPEIVTTCTLCEQTISIFSYTSHLKTTHGVTIRLRRRPRRKKFRPHDEHPVALRRSRYLTPIGGSVGWKRKTKRR